LLKIVKKFYKSIIFLIDDGFIYTFVDEDLKWGEK